MHSPNLNVSLCAALERMLHCRDMKLAATTAGVDTSAMPRIGSVITVPAKQMQPYGMVCDIPGDSNLAGLIATSNLPPGDLSPGDITEAAVMDVHELDGIVDLSASEVSRFSLKSVS